MGPRVSQDLRSPSLIMAPGIYLHYRVNKQRDTSFKFSSILSTVDLSNHLITP